MALLAALKVEHCIDDIMGAERRSTVQSGWSLWWCFADHCGWRVPDKKPPLPACVGIALGAQFDLTHFPHHPIIVRLSQQRIHNICDVLDSFLTANRLGNGLSGQLWGKLQHACSMLWGRYGICKLRPFSRRQHEHRANLNPQLCEAIHWWLRDFKESLFPTRSPCTPIRAEKPGLLQ